MKNFMVNDNLIKYREKTYIKNNKEYKGYEAKVCIGIDNATRRKIYRNFHGNTLDSLKEKISYSYARNKLLDTTSLSFIEYAYRYQELTDCLRETSTNIKIEININKHLKPYFKETKLIDITYEKVIKYIEYRKKQTCINRIIVEVNLIKKILDLAVMENYISFNPIIYLRLRQTPYKEREYLDEKEIKLFIKEAKSYKCGNLLITILLNGLRKNEAVGLTWDKVDLDNRALIINQQYVNIKYKGKKYVGIKDHTKNKTKRILAISDSQLLIFKEELTKQKEYSKYEYYHNDLNLVFTNKFGKPLRTDYDFNKIKLNINKPNLVLHSLRHTYASYLANKKGATLVSVQEEIGHASPMSTQNYIHTSTNTSKKVSNIIDNDFFKVLINEDN